MNLRHWTDVFSFTFREQLRGKGFRLTTLIVALAFLIVIPAVMLLSLGSGGAAQETVCTAEHAVVYDAAGLPYDWSGLSAYGCAGISYAAADSLDGALDAAKAAGGRSLVLEIQPGESGYALTVILPEGTELSQSDASAYEDFLQGCFGRVLAASAGLTAEQAAALSVSVSYTVARTDAGPAEAEQDQSLMAGVRIGLPYLIVMLLYFLILFYGQGVANSVILEKTSKLMDTFLVSVHPSAMILGKMLAIAAAGLLQLCCWIAGIAGGFAAGALAVRLADPAADMGILRLLDRLGAASGLFAPAAVAVAAALVICGFLLYCALSAIGGSLASKQEDLSSTNILFSLILVVSFLIALQTDTLKGSSAESTWIYYVPFTAVLTVPGRILLGDLSLGQGLASLGLTAAATLLLVLAAGKTYVLMSFWKGDPPSLKKLFRLLVSRRTPGRDA